VNKTPRSHWVGAIVAAGLAYLVSQVYALAGPSWSYPPARRSDQVDVYHRISVADPYRWMEDVDSPETRAWVESEETLTREYLAKIGGRDAIGERLKGLWNYERWSAPEKHGSGWFYSHNSGLQNQSVHFVTADPREPGRELLDPNSLSTDGTVAFKSAAFTDDGRLMAYGLSESGSDWETWRIRTVATGQDLPDLIRHAKYGSASWRKDGSGFYYCGYKESDGESLKAANTYHTLYFHRLGTPQSGDVIVYRRTDDVDWFIAGSVSDDGRYLIVTATHGDEVQNTILVQELRRPAAALKALIAEPRASFVPIGNVGSVLYVQTDQDAPRNRVVAIDLHHPETVSWRSVIPEAADTLISVSLVGHQLIAQYLSDAHSVVRRYTTAGKRLADVPLPGIGTAEGFVGRIDDAVTYFAYTDYRTPVSIYRLDLKTGSPTRWRGPILTGYKPDSYQTRQVFFPSKDGTRIPMFITARKGTVLDGQNPTLLYGYGGFNVPEQPEFTPAIAGWLESGGVYVAVNLRGGGEYGRAWHEAGMKIHKQNVFDDFIGAAEYLIAEKWTSRSRLAIQGASNGGLLIAAVEEQRPELFAAAIAQVGVMDMLRFREFTIGKGWESDYGSVDSESEFRALRAYSPVHNVKANVDYPATLILTGDHDDRVFPAHSFKFAAAMQAADPNGRPVLIRIDLRAGHGAGKPLAKRVDEIADAYAFIRQAMGLPPDIAGERGG
jgi:prolyl oligopeptidase